MPPADSLELFSAPASRACDPRAPLADRMRPRSLDEIAGQEHLLRPGAALRSLVEAGEVPSLIFWGPPGCGKTTLARLLAGRPDTRLESLSAVMAGVKEIRAVVERARRERQAGCRTVLFLDELHRLNRAQQDALLPHVETGVVTLIGATTENPSFEVIAPLLSRCRVFTLLRLEPDALAGLVRRAAQDAERGLGRLKLVLSEDVVEAIAHAADGDARRALGLLEAAAAIHLQASAASAQRGEAERSPEGGAAAQRGEAERSPEGGAAAERAEAERSPEGGAAAERAEGSLLPLEAVQEAAGKRLLLHDRDREEHYNVVSAMIKSLRASDPDAALYYAARMLEAGEDPLFVARRLVVFASEDVGNAEPTALGVAVAAFQAVERIGMPEGRIPLAQAVTFLACAPKSNASYTALEAARQAVAEHGSLPVPLHLRNAPTRLMKELGYGRDYEYPHDAPDRFVATPNLPPELGRPRFYQPTREGAEREIAERLEEWRRRRRPTR